jgi:flagellar hook-associated protein 1 FlgK
MSLSLALGNALSGLRAAQASLATISNNVANANTEGYTRKIQPLSTQVLAGVGSGVATPAVLRQVDEFLRRDVRREGSILGAAQVRDSYLGQLQQLIGGTASGGTVNTAINDLQRALNALGSSPEDLGQQQNVVATARNVAFAINRMGRSVQDLRQASERELQASVSTINQNLQKVVSLNRQITRAFALRQPTGDLQDERDLAVAAISREMGIQTFVRDSGEMVVYSATGRTMVDGTSNLIQYTPTNNVNAKTTFPAIKLGTDSLDITREFTSGRMQALLEVRDSTLPELSRQLNLLSRALYENTWSPPFVPSSTAQGVDQSGQNPFAIVSFAGNLKSDAPAGTTSGPIQFNATVVDGKVTNPGFGLVDNAGNVYNATFEVRKTSAANQWQVFLTGLTPAVPPAGNPTAATMFTFPPPPQTASLSFQGGAVPPLGAGGGLSIGFIDSTSALQNNFINLQVQVSNAPPTQLSMQLRFNPSDFRATTAATTVEPRSETYRLFQGVNLGDPSTDSSVSLSLNSYFDPNVGGSPARLFVANDKTPPVAQRMADRLLQNVDTRLAPYNQISTALSGGIYSTQQFASAIVSNNSVLAKQAKDNNDYQEQYVLQLQNKSAEIDGVNIDEELSSMILYQNAYQASARVMATTQELFDVLLSIGV